eukprot:s2646_g4.t1
MEAKEMLKQQVRMIKESVEDKTVNVPCSQSSKVAKHFLRVLSIWSMMGLADGTMLSNLAQLGADSVKALSWWRGIQSPMMIASILGLLCTLVLVTYMIPCHAHESEPDPEQPEGSEHAESFGHAVVTGEPSTEPQPSRYPMDERSLGCKFPAVFIDPMFRCEGVLIWLYHRSELRIARDNKPILNTMRMNELSQMMHLCMDGLSPDEAENMKDSLLALSDLSDDETSPTHGASEESVRTSFAQAYQAYQIGMNMFGHLRRPAQGSDDENVENPEERYNRYVQSDIHSVSDPAEWMAIQVTMKVTWKSQMRNLPRYADDAIYSVSAMKSQMENNGMHGTRNAWRKMNRSTMKLSVKPKRDLMQKKGMREMSTFDASVICSR